MDKDIKPILVSKPYLPPLDEYVEYLKKIWDNNWLTNNGPIVRELEQKLKEFLGVKHFFFTSNGTIAMQIAIKALNLTGEILTTPYTYVATTNSILWEGCTPVFVDIDPENFGIDPAKIEARITDKTQAIMAVHVYGNPNRVAEIEAIAKKHNLKVIYDAAHCFGTKIDGRSILEYGDISTLSFHATKIFHTIEGGAIITNDDALAEKISLYRSFGHVGDDHKAVGINGKNSEFHAAMGLVNLEKFSDIVKERKELALIYDKYLNKSVVRTLSIPENIEFNFAYYPVIFKTEEDLFLAKEALEQEKIFPRRYFYPSLNTVSFVPFQSCPVSENISKRALCLPFYNTLNPLDVKRIATILNKAISQEEETPTIPSLTIGIPAHNEEKNIGKLLRSIFSQQNLNYKLAKVIVVLDGCTDDTVYVVRGLRKEFPKITLFNDSKRLGKTSRLNELYKLNKSDFILTLDGDIILDEPGEIDEMFRVFNETPGSCMVAANLSPIIKPGFFGKVLKAHQKLWDNLRTSLNGGDHITNSYGCANLLSNSFSRSFALPSELTCDEELLYILAKQKEGFRFAKNTSIKYVHASTLKELRKQTTRFLTERNSLIPYFGEEVVKLHNIPASKKVWSILASFVKDPIYTILALGLNFYLRLAPEPDSLNQLGMWESIQSSKLLGAEA